MNYERTVEVLNKLVNLGMTDDAFAELHHSQIPGNYTSTIRSHLRYAAKTKECSDNSANARVQQRLEFVLAVIDRGGVRPTEQVFKTAAIAAWLAIPEPNDAPRERHR
jgi:hypothetical protein